VLLPQGLQAQVPVSPHPEPTPQRTAPAALRHLQGHMQSMMMQDGFKPGEPGPADCRFLARNNEWSLPKLQFIKLPQLSVLLSL
jgi:hypothetical protein